MATEPVTDLELQYPNPRVRREMQARMFHGGFQFQGVRTGRFQSHAFNNHTNIPKPDPAQIRAVYKLHDDETYVRVH